MNKEYKYVLDLLQIHENDDAHERFFKLFNVLMLMANIAKKVVQVLT